MAHFELRFRAPLTDAQREKILRVGRESDRRYDQVRARRRAVKVEAEEEEFETAVD